MVRELFTIMQYELLMDDVLFYRRQIGIQFMPSGELDIIDKDNKGSKDCLMELLAIITRNEQPDNVINKMRSVLKESVKRPDLAEKIASINKDEGTIIEG